MFGSVCHENFGRLGKHSLLNSPLISSLRPSCSILVFYTGLGCVKSSSSWLVQHEHFDIPRHGVPSKVMCHVFPAAQQVLWHCGLCAKPPRLMSRADAQRLEPCVCVSSWRTKSTLLWSNYSTKPVMIGLWVPVGCTLCSPEWRLRVWSSTQLQPPHISALSQSWLYVVVRHLLK